VEQLSQGSRSKWFGAPYAARFLNTIIAQTSARLTGPTPGAKAGGHPVCLDVNSRSAKQRKLIAPGVRVPSATSDVELVAGGALRALGANRETIGDEAAGVDSAPAIIDVRRHMSYTMG
jgi:hypothetical protein